MLLVYFSKSINVFIMHQGLPEIKQYLRKFNRYLNIADYDDMQHLLIYKLIM